MGTEAHECRWQDLIVLFEAPSPNEDGPTLAEYLDEAEDDESLPMVRSDGGVGSWMYRYICYPSTLREVNVFNNNVDWTGFADAVKRAREHPVGGD